MSEMMNYIFGILIACEKIRFRKILLFLGVVFNISLLAFFKYFNFFAGSINRVLGNDTISLSQFALPLGISFYTFQAMSYVIDVYKKEVNETYVSAGTSAGWTGIRYSSIFF